MRPDDPRTQAEIDADIAQLRAELISVINPDLAYRLRGIARMADTSPSGVFNTLLYDAGVFVELADAALAFTAHSDRTTVRALVAATDRLRAQVVRNGHPANVADGAVAALKTLNGK